MPNVVYIGYDPSEDIAYSVLKYSIRKRTISDTRIIPLSLPNITSIFNRPIIRRGKQLWCPISDAPMSTEFAISRFCVPFLQEKGWALFMDCDMLLNADIDELFNLADEKYAVMVVKHKHETGGDEKMVGLTQTYYHRKNWSSVVLWNCSHPANKRLTLDDINSWPGRDLHAFKWLSDEEIGELPKEWNFLVDVNSGDLSKQKILHYTNGGMWFDGWEKKKSDKMWEKEYELFKKESIKELV